MSNALHIPVLLNEVIDTVKRLDGPIQSGLDVTFGRGGHTSALLSQFSELKILGLDQDFEAIEFGQKKYKDWIEQGRLQLQHQSFHDAVEVRDVDFILADLGVSSPQLDQPQRGFSFYHDGPLDMRMDQRRSLTAADIVNEWPAQELSDLFYQLGEIKRPNRLVARLIERRQERRFESTLDLAQLIEKTEGWQKKGQHPATQYFLALRLAVNHEIEALKTSIEGLMHCLRMKGFLIVITFHSLEDRIIKYAFKESTLGYPFFNKVIIPKREEELENPRARSAKLRVFIRASLEEKGAKNKYRRI